MRIWDEAGMLEGRLIQLRRDLHKHAEVGLELPCTKAIVKKWLDQEGIPYQELGYGIVARIGKKEGRHILLRADMDALPMPEETGLPFASQSPDTMHACGHDMHAAMLLGAACLLKKREAELCGKVTLMFQAGEEGFCGALHMVESGLLDDPVDAAVAIHMAAMEQYPTGIIVPALGTVHASNDRFDIVVTGKSCHAAEPHNGRNPLLAAFHIATALHSLPSRECSAVTPAVISFCQVNGGTADNVIPETCRLVATLRTSDESVRTYLLERIPQVAHAIGEGFGVQAQTIFAPVALPCNINNDSLVHKISELLSRDLPEVMQAPVAPYPNLGSEDFSFVSQKVPSCYLSLISQSPQGHHYPEHNTHVLYDEKALPVGAAVYAQAAYSYLAEF